MGPIQHVPYVLGIIYNYYVFIKYCIFCAVNDVYVSTETIAAEEKESITPP